MGLSRSQSEEVYDAKLQEQFEKNYTASLKYLNSICQASRYEVLNWTEKSFGDALMYAVSIMSTIGKKVQSVYNVQCIILYILYIQCILYTIHSTAYNPSVYMVHSRMGCVLPPHVATQAYYDWICLHWTSTLWGLHWYV